MKADWNYNKLRRYKPFLQENDQLSLASQWIHLIRTYLKILNKVQVQTLFLSRYDPTLIDSLLPTMGSV